MDREEALDRIANRVGEAPLNLKGADLSDAILTNANLLGANLTRADLSGADLSGADLSGANLSRANLRRAHLWRANLTNANLTNANLTDANLTDANLLGVNLTRANLALADLSGANLSRAHLRRAHLWRANLRGADLSGADLSGANLRGANLTDANLLGANLTGTILTGVNLLSASLTGAILTVADLAGANLASEVDPFARLVQVLAGYEPLQGKNLQARVEKWAAQFEKGVRQRVVEETAHVLENTLITRTAAEQILETLITDPRMCGGGDIRDWWKSSNFLQLPTKGQSQGEMRVMIDKSLQNTHGFSIADCGSELQRYVYLDDVVCTGTQWKWAVKGWLEREKAKLAGDEDVHLWLIALVVYRDRLDNRIEYLKDVATGHGISLKVGVWPGFQMMPSALWPTFKPKRYDASSPVEKLREELKPKGHPMKLRKNLTDPNCIVFSSEDARDLLEREFLTAGCRIKYELCPKFKENHWPLGWDVFPGMGFGTPIVTWRNCPNSAPLALWADPPWFPLLPRDNNSPGLDVAGVTG